MAHVFQLVVDCHDPSRLVAFWGPLLGYGVPPAPAPHATWRDWYVALGVPADEIGGDGTDRLVPPDGDGVAIWFQAVPETKTLKNRLHLDLRVSGGRATPRAQRRAAIESAAAGIEAAGGRTVRIAETSEADHVFALMTDPEGNEFCLV